MKPTDVCIEWDQTLSGISAVSLERHKPIAVGNITYHFVSTQEQYFYGWPGMKLINKTLKLPAVKKH